MSFQSEQPVLIPDEEGMEKLGALSDSRSEPMYRIDRGNVCSRYICAGDCSVFADQSA